MTTTPDRTAQHQEPPGRSSRRLAWFIAITGALSVLAICLLALTGHAEEATAVGLVGGAALAASGISVTINLRR